MLSSEEWFIHCLYSDGVGDTIGGVGAGGVGVTAGGAIART